MFVECFNLECLVFMCSTTTEGAGHYSSEIVHLPNCKLMSGAKVNWLTLLLTQFSHFVLQCSSYQQWWFPWWIEQEVTIGLQIPFLSKSSRLYLQFCRVVVVLSFPVCLQNKWIVMLFQNFQGHSASWEVLHFSQCFHLYCCLSTTTGNFFFSMFWV
jgi:hypothetical protein